LIDNTTSNLKNSWAKAALSIYGNETDLAKKTYDLWERTFNSIAKVRMQVFTETNKSIMDTFYNDADTLDTLIQVLMKRYKMTLGEALKYLSNPELTEADKQKLLFTPFEASDWLQSGD